MQVYPLSKVNLKDTKIHNIRMVRFRKAEKEQKVYIPLQVLPKSLNKINTCCRDYNISRGEKKATYFEFKPIDEKDYQTKGPIISQEVTSSNTEEINPQQHLQKQHSEKKQEIARPQLSLKKINIFKSRRCICGDCEQCFKDFAYFLHIFSSDQSIPDITAKSWCIWRKNKNNNKFMHYYGKRIHKVREIASLTKIVTSMTTMDYLQKYDLDPEKITYEIRKTSVMIGGTRANLQIGEVYTIKQLLYGLMLPSGNDAAIALSEAIGLLYHIRVKGKHVDPYKQQWYSQFLNTPTKSYSYLFINMMNEKCQKLGLLDTHFYNSHGNDAYDQLKNVSTCNEVAKMSGQYMMKYDYLKNIVITKIYKVERYNKCWQNTNKLLDDGFEGIKTGITDTAGPCLSACYRNYIIIVLNSKSMNERWIQVKKLVKWIVNKNI